MLKSCLINPKYLPYNFDLSKFSRYFNNNNNNNNNNKTKKSRNFLKMKNFEQKKLAIRSAFRNDQK